MTTDIKIQIVPFLAIAPTPDNKPWSSFIYIEDVRLDIIVTGESEGAVIESATKFWESEHPKARSRLGLDHVAEAEVITKPGKKTRAKTK